jgi:hypothetical protein
MIGKINDPAAPIVVLLPAALVVMEVVLAATELLKDAVTVPVAP